MTQMVSSLRCDVQRIPAAAWLVGAVALLLWAARVEALQMQQTASSALEQRIEHEANVIHAGERAGLEPLKLGRLWAHIATEYEDEAEFSKSEDAYNRALKLLRPAPEGATSYAIVLDNLGSLYLATGNLNAAEGCRKQAMALHEAAGDRLQIARSESLLAEVSLARHKFKDAEQQSMEAYREMVAVKDAATGEMVGALVTLTYASCMNRHCAEGVEHGREAILLAHEAFAANSLPMGEARMALGYAEWKAGMKDDADGEMREGIEILKEWRTPGHPYVLGAMDQYRKYLDETHHKREAQQIAEEEKRLQGAPSASCANCTVSVYGLRGR